MDLYVILGVEPDADVDQIRRAYRRRALEHHPDRNDDDLEAAERLRLVRHAFQVLSDPKLRELYDVSAARDANVARPRRPLPRVANEPQAAKRAPTEFTEGDGWTVFALICVFFPPLWPFLLLFLLLSHPKEFLAVTFFLAALAAIIVGAYLLAGGNGVALLLLACLGVWYVMRSWRQSR